MILAASCYDQALYKRLMYLIVLALQLRELVPARGKDAAAEGADSKRPKHTVLSDTITLLKDQRSQVRMHCLVLPLISSVYRQCIHTGPSPGKCC